MDHPSVADFMDPVPATIDATETLRAAAEAMAEHGVGMLVIRSGPTAVGVVTDRDLVVRGLAAGLGTDDAVQGVVAKEVVTVGYTDLVETAFDVMRAAAVRRVPVLDGDALVGVLSYGDLAGAR